MTEETSLIKEDFYENETIFNYCTNFIGCNYYHFGYKIVQTYIEDKQERANYEKLQQKFQMLMSKHQAHVRPQFESLEKINKDIVGWIKLSGTSLNYPVLQGKTNHDYLNLDFEREHRRKGSILWILEMN